MKVCLIQMHSNGTKEENERKSYDMLRGAVKDKPDVICLSELFLSWGPDLDCSKVEEKDLVGYQEFALENHVNLILGTVSLKSADSKKTTNTSFVINREGKITSRYDKIYMYKVNRKNLIVDETVRAIPRRKKWDI